MQGKGEVCKGRVRCAREGVQGKGEVCKVRVTDEVTRNTGKSG